MLLWRLSGARHALDGDAFERYGFFRKRDDGALDIRHR